MNKHRYDCEVFELSDLLKEMMLHEEQFPFDGKLRGFINDMIDCINAVDDKVNDLEEDLMIAHNEIHNWEERHAELIEKMEDAINGN